MFKPDVDTRKKGQFSFSFGDNHHDQRFVSFLFEIIYSMNILFRRTMTKNEQMSGFFASNSFNSSGTPQH